MLIAQLDLRYAAFCPTPDLFDDLKDYEEMINLTAEAIYETIYMERMLELKGFNLGITDDTF